MNDLNLIVTTEEISMPLDEQDPSLNLYREFLRSEATKQAFDQGKARGLINSTDILDFNQQEFERLRLATERRVDIQNPQQQQIKKDQKSNKFANENTGSVTPADSDVVEYCAIIKGKNGKEKQTEKSQIVSVQSTIASLTDRAENDLQQIKEVCAGKKKLSEQEIKKIKALSSNYLANQTSADSKKEYLKKFTSPVNENQAQESSLDQAPPLAPKGIKPTTAKINKVQQDDSPVGKSTGAIKKCAQATSFSQSDKNEREQASSSDRKKIFSIWDTDVYLTSNQSNLSSSNSKMKITDAQEVNKTNSSQTNKEKLNAELARQKQLARKREMAQQKRELTQQNPSVLFKLSRPQEKVQAKKTHAKTR